MSVKTRITVRQGFTVHVLANERVRIAIVPELGARIISLKNLQTGREWMSRPPGKLKLFRNRLGDDFSRSPLLGVDECLPTIAPCQWRGRALPDHGEVWSAAWSVDAAAWECGDLKLKASLPISPFHFERTLRLRGNEILVSYRLQNRSRVAEHFLWALHPLFKLHRGDTLKLPKSSRALLNGQAWGDHLSAAIPKGNCSKLFVGPLRDGAVGLRNRLTGDYVDFKWRPNENNTLGLWLTRGGWHGHHHFAMEPTNGDTDALSAAVSRKRCGLLPARGEATWQLRLRVGP